MSSHGKKRASCALLTASTISLALLTSGCAGQPSDATSGASLQIVESRGPLGTTNLDEASAAAGDPLIVTSRVSVEVGRYSSLTGKDGGRVQSKDITGWMTSPREVFFDLYARIQRAEAAVTRANEAAVKAGQRNAILEILANKCRDDSVCFAAAKPHIARVMGGR